MGWGLWVGTADGDAKRERRSYHLDWIAGWAIKRVGWSSKRGDELQVERVLEDVNSDSSSMHGKSCKLASAYG